jgi:hypothetical protein
MADKDAARPYTIDDLLHATRELEHARGVLKDKQLTLKRHRDAIKSFEQDEINAEAEVAKREVIVKKIASNLEK